MQMKYLRDKTYTAFSIQCSTPRKLSAMAEMFSTFSCDTHMNLGLTPSSVHTGRMGLGTSLQLELHVNPPQGCDKPDLSQYSSKTYSVHLWNGCVLTWRHFSFLSEPRYNGGWYKR
jgi:hypothetical protein